MSQLPHLLEEPLTNVLTLLALAAVFFLRSIAGFGFPIFAPEMFRSLGYGPGNTVLAAVAFVIGVPACVIFVSPVPLPAVPDSKVLSPILLWKFGERIRNASVYAVKTPPPTSGR